MPKPTAKELAQAHSDWIPQAVQTLIEARGRQTLGEIFSELGPEVIGIVKEQPEPVYLVLMKQHTMPSASTKKAG